MTHASYRKFVHWTKRSTARLGTLMLGLAGALGLMTVSGTANAVPVDLELVLAVDVSTSVDSTEFNLQKQGYVDAFNNPVIQQAINDGAIGSIAATLVYWSTNQEQSVAWNLIDDGTAGITAADFAALIDGTTRPGTGSIGFATGIGDAITFSDGLFDPNGYEGTRTVIDVSGDGTSNIGSDPSTAGAAATTYVE